MKMREGNVFSHACLAVILFTGSQAHSSTPLSRAPVMSPPLDMFKPVQIGLHYTRTPYPKTCSKLLTMKHRLSASGWLAFDWNAFLLSSATKLRRLCFYTCLSVHRRGICLSACWDTPWDQALPKQTPPVGPGTPQTRHPPRADTPQAQAPLEQTPSWNQTPPPPALECILVYIVFTFIVMGCVVDTTFCVLFM